MVDISKMVVAEEPEDFVLDLGDGETITIKVKPLTWFDESDAAAAAFQLMVKTDGDGKPVPMVEYNVTKFRTVMLKARIVDAPFPVTDQFLRRLKPAVGQQLDALVPDPFSSMKLSETVPNP